MNEELHLKVGKKYVATRYNVEKIEFTFIGANPPQVEIKGKICTLEEALGCFIDIKEIK